MAPLFPGPISAHARRLMRMSRYAWSVTAILLIVSVCYWVINDLTKAALPVETILYPDTVILLGLILALIGAAGAIAAAALSHLTRRAAAIQDENDLTI